MSATCDPLVRGQTFAAQSPARICIAYDIALRTIVIVPCKIFPLIRFEGAERVQQIFKAVDNLRELRPALHKAAQS